MKLFGLLKKMGQWLSTPITDEEIPTGCREIFPTPGYYTWVQAGQPQEFNIDLTWDGKKEDNPHYDRRLAYARARLRELLVEEIQRKKEQEKVRKETNKQAAELKKALNLGPGFRRA